MNDVPAVSVNARASALVERLRADAPTLWRRLQQDPASASQRPDLARGGLAEIEQLLRAREPHYSGVAHLTVDTASRTRT